MEPPSIKDVTSTSFGLIVAYLLPGLAALYPLAVYCRGFGKHLMPLDVGGFLLLVLVALLIGVFVNGVRGAIHWGVGRLVKRFTRWNWDVGDEYFSQITNAEKLACFMAVLDEYFRVHQFFGSLALIMLVLYFPTLYLKHSGVFSGIGPPLFVGIWLRSIAAAIGAAILSWKFYVNVGPQDPRSDGAACEASRVR